MRGKDSQIYYYIQAIIQFIDQYTNLLDKKEGSE
jgi:hypothetical protein